jgi:hypothetical protein
MEMPRIVEEVKRDLAHKSIFRQDIKILHLTIDEVCD